MSVFKFLKTGRESGDSDQTALNEDLISLQNKTEDSNSLNIFNGSADGIVDKFENSLGIR